MVNQILTRQELMLSFLLQALVHMEFKEDHKQYVNQVTHAGEEKEQFSTSRASVDALCRDGTSEISRDPRTKRLQTRRESLARPSKHTNNNF